MIEFRCNDEKCGYVSTRHEVIGIVDAASKSQDLKNKIFSYYLKNKKKRISEYLTEANMSLKEFLLTGDLEGLHENYCPKCLTDSYGCISGVVDFDLPRSLFDQVHSVVVDGEKCQVKDFYLSMTFPPLIPGSEIWAKVIVHGESGSCTTLVDMDFKSGIKDLVVTRCFNGSWQLFEKEKDKFQKTESLGDYLKSNEELLSVYIIK